MYVRSVGTLVDKRSVSSHTHTALVLSVVNVTLNYFVHPVGQSGDHPCHRCPYPVVLLPADLPNHETSAHQQLRLATVWPQQTWAENWGAVPLRRTASPSNTMWPRPRPSSVPSGILIIQPFGHNRHGPKTGVCPFGDGELCPHLTQYGQS